jgi:hypothetical protein
LSENEQNKAKGKITLIDQIKEKVEAIGGISELFKFELISVEEE